MLVSDVGSMPVIGMEAEFLEGAKLSQSLTQYTGYGNGFKHIQFFEDQVIRGLSDKMIAGIDVPTYPQFRDMSTMFLSIIKGVEKTRSGYIATGKLSLDPGRMIPEAYAVRSNLARVSGLKLKLCVTGPHTLSTYFSVRPPELLTELGRVLAEVMANSIFRLDDGETVIVSMDEPTFGLVDDPMLDIGSRGRDCLRSAWENIAHAAKSRGLETMIHLHSTADSLMWEVPSLDILSSHVNDPLYDQPTRRLLSETGKRLSAGVAVSSFDDILRNLAYTPEEIGVIWRRIESSQVDPASYLESHTVIRKRLDRVINLFGEENIPYAGPECGFGGHPTYGCALFYLGKIAATIKEREALGKGARARAV
jgi:5-methyltetrahydropteroyltriglutamate--homocysteine methyltransferase